MSHFQCALLSSMVSRQLEHDEIIVFAPVAHGSDGGEIPYSENRQSEKVSEGLTAREPILEKDAIASVPRGSAIYSSAPLSH